MRTRDWYASLVLLALVGCATRAPSPLVLEPVPLSPRLAEQVLGSALRGVEFWLNSAVPYCLLYEDGDGWAEPDPALLRRLSLHHQVLRRRDCPPTYSGMIRYVDSLGNDIGPKKPAGYINPYKIRITPPVALTPKAAVIRLQAMQGSNGWTFFCVVYMAQPDRADCGEPNRYYS